MKRYFLVGYFKRNEHKLNFAEILPQENLHFLEASTFVKDNPDENTFHAPQRLYGLSLSKRWKYSHKKIPINNFTRELYRRDLKAYYANLLKPERPISKSIIFKPTHLLLYSCWHFQKCYKKRKATNALTRIPLVLFDFLKKFSIRSCLAQRNVKQVRSFLLKHSFVAGYNYYLDLFSKLKPNKEDIFLVWGEHYSSNLLIKNLLSETGADHRVLEFGEVSGTVSINKDGIFGKSDIADDFDNFQKLDISKEDTEEMKNYLNRVVLKETSSRSGVNGFYDLCANLFQSQENRKKIIYVNGSELIASGHTVNLNLMGRKYTNPNKELLTRVCDSVDMSQYIVMYKDHPMAFRQSKKLLLKSNEFPGVVFCDRGMNMTTLLNIADLVVTFPSKVVMSALMNKNKVLVIGEFTVKGSNHEIGLYGRESLGSINELVNTENECNYSEIEDNITRMLKYKLIKYDTELFTDFDIEVERKKLLSIL